MLGILKDLETSIKFCPEFSVYVPARRIFPSSCLSGPRLPNSKIKIKSTTTIKQLLKGILEIQGNERFYSCLSLQLISLVCFTVRWYFIRVVVSWVYAYVKIHQAVYLRFVHFILCIFFFNKVCLSRGRGA